MQGIFEGKRFHYISCLLIAAVTLIVYSNTFNSSFHFDDTIQIVENYKLKDLKNLPEILIDQRGLTMATFALNYAVSGMNVVGYHIVNTMIHITNGILVYLLILLTLNLTTRSNIIPAKSDEGWSRKIALYSALLFAVHPIQTQTVVYIVQRMESLSSLFYLLSVLLFIKGATASTRTKRGIFYGSVVISYLLGFYSKEIAITIPAIIFLYDLYFIAGGKIREVLSRWPLYAVLVFLLSFFTARILIPVGGFSDLSNTSAGFGVKSITPWEYLLTQFNVILYYITLLLIPTDQNLDYDFPISKGLFETPTINEGAVLHIPIPPPFISLLILLCLMGIAIYLYCSASTKNGRHSSYKVISFFIFWFFIILFPTSSFIPIIDVIFEHRVYLASTGFFVIFAIAFDRVFAYLERKQKGKG